MTDSSSTKSGTCTHDGAGSFFETFFVCCCSDSDGKNPMVAGVAEDIDSEDETATPAIVNHVNEESNSREQFTTPKKPAAAVNVELTSSEEEEEEEYKRNQEEERKERDNRRKKEDRAKEKHNEGGETVELKLEMPVKSLMTEEPAVDGIGLGTENVDDWLNSPDSDPKVRFSVVWFKLL